MHRVRFSDGCGCSDIIEKAAQYKIDLLDILENNSIEQFTGFLIAKFLPGTLDNLLDGAESAFRPVNQFDE